MAANYSWDFWDWGTAGTVCGVHFLAQSLCIFGNLWIVGLSFLFVLGDSLETRRHEKIIRRR